MFVRSGSATIISLMLISTLFAAERKPHITGIYTDLRYNSEAGDLLGTEIFIVFTGNGYAAFFQHWEGGAAPPVVVSVKVDGTRVSFAVPAPSDGEGVYEARIANGGLEGVWRHPLADGTTKEEHIHLARKPSYWQ